MEDREGVELEEVVDQRVVELVKEVVMVSREQAEREEVVTFAVAV